MPTRPCVWDGPALLRLLLSARQASSSCSSWDASHSARATSRRRSLVVMCPRSLNCLISADGTPRWSRFTLFTRTWRTS